MEKIITNSSRETRDFAKKLAEKIKGGVIALSGELGAGKTVFVQGLAEGLGIKEKIISPTFVLIRQHKIPNSAKFLYHVDLYRLDDNTDIKNLGLDELFSDPNAILVIEWAEKLKELPKGTIKVFLLKESLDKRKIIIHNS